MRDRGYDPTWPIAAWGGVVVDGHTRLAAAKAAKLRTVFYVDRPFDNESEALEYAIKCQTNRRNLTDAEMLRCVQELDKRKAVGRPPQAETPQPCGITGRTAEATAATLGISQRKVAPGLPPSIRSPLTVQKPAGTATLRTKRIDTLPDRPPEPFAGDSRPVSPGTDRTSRVRPKCARRAASRAGEGDLRESCHVAYERSPCCLREVGTP